MNEHDPVEGPASHLRDRMERAVGDLPRAPEVVPRAMARGRRQRTRRRLAFAAGGVAAATALALTVPTFVGSWSGQEQDPSGPQAAADPTSAISSIVAARSSAPATDLCDPETGWWSKSSAQVQAELSALLPQGTSIGQSTDDSVGRWNGNLLTGDDADFVRFELSPPDAVRAARSGGTSGEARRDRQGRTDLSQLDDDRLPPACDAEPVLAGRPCAEITSDAEELVVACEEIRSANGTLIGMVTDETEMRTVNGTAQPTDRSHISAFVAGPGGGYLELAVYDGDSIQAENPSTVLDPADTPALTMGQVRDIATNAVWTS